MFRYVSCALAVVMFAGLSAPAPITRAQAPAPKAEPDAKAPVAKITGPSKAKVGEQLKYTTEGSKGSDILFSISPPTVGFEPVKLLDGKDTPGVIFTPSRGGVYYIYVMLNDNGKTGYTLLVLDVQGGGGNVDPVNPDKSFFALKEAIAADHEKDAQSGQYVAQLESLMGQWDALSAAASSWEQFNKMFKDAATTALEDKLQNTRKAIGAYIGTRFPKNASDSFNRDLVKTVKNEILQTIRVSK
jgi:hypothetical protein